MGHLSFRWLPRIGHGGSEQLGKGGWLITHPHDVATHRLQPPAGVDAARDSKSDMPVVTCDDSDPREIEQRMEITSGRDVEVATRGGVPELVQPTFNRDAAGVYDDDVLAQMLHHIELMTGEQHGGACP